jgi:iron complex transport system substrate-binding protein
VSLAPHLAELVFAVGAGDMLVGVSAYTDYPEAAAQLPVIGDAFGLDQERLAVLRPDVLLAWKSGTPAHVVDEIRARGYRVDVISTKSIDDIPIALKQIGAMTGHAEDADAVSKKFEDNLRMLAVKNNDAESIRVFYQIATRPLYTVNAEHYVSELIEICGGTNVFADLGGLAPLIGVEAVLQRNPEVILASTDAGPDAFLHWGRWPDLAANRYANRFLMPADEIGRATPRLLVAAQAMCKALDQGRSNRAANRE